MHFEHLPSSHNLYLNEVLSIIRRGILLEKQLLQKSTREDIKNQQLAECFNILGTKNEKNWIGVSQEHQKFKDRNREDIYFYLDDDNRTRIFFVEGKRLPKSGTTSDEEYVVGISSTGKPSGGIERFKLGLHGSPSQMNCYGILAYVENKSILSWLEKINKTIQNEFPSDTLMTQEPKSKSDFFSTHKLNDTSSNIHIYHFWIDLTQ